MGSKLCWTRRGEVCLSCLCQLFVNMLAVDFWVGRTFNVLTSHNYVAVYFGIFLARLWELYHGFQGE
jgi:hypothetical protein